MRRKHFWAMVISAASLVFGFGMIVLNGLALAAVRFATIFGTPENEMDQNFWMQLGLGIAIVALLGFLTSAGAFLWRSNGEPS